MIKGMITLEEINGIEEVEQLQLTQQSLLQCVKFVVDWGQTHPLNCAWIWIESNAILFDLGSDSIALR